MNPYVAACLADGAVGLWPLDESTLPTARDQTGNSDGTYTNSAGINLDQIGIPGGSGSTATRFFAASDGYVQIPCVVVNEVTNAGYTIEAWVKIGSTGSEQQVFTLAPGGNPTMQLDASSPPLLQSVKFGTALVCSSTSGVPVDGNFHHLVVTKAGTTSHLYIDGADVTGAVIDAVMSTSSGFWSVSLNSASGSFLFDGTATMVALYPSALSPSAVANHYQLGSSVVKVSALVPPPIRGLR